jgi:8-oxo-dGTP pyrophosphatase MutT (NUDIX family)
MGRLNQGDPGMGRIEYYDDPSAPLPNSLVPASNMVVVDDRGAILLQRRRDTGQWALPGGKQEIGETPAQCAVRECEEETGVLAEVVEILGVYSDPAHIIAYTDGEVRQEYEVTLIGKPVSGKPSVNEEASDVRWVLPSNLEMMDIHPTQRRQIDDYLTHKYPHVD